MIILIQRASRAEVRVDGEVVGRITSGLLLFVGIETGDGDLEIKTAVRKIPDLRLFEDENGRFDCSLNDADGDLLIVSQFTLPARLVKGRRPTFDRAIAADQAEPVFERLVAAFRERLGKSRIETGRFGATMEVELVNDGPATFIWNSADRR